MKEELVNKETTTKLSDLKVKQKARVVLLNIDDKIRRRLEVIGLTRGTLIEVLNKKVGGSLILKVRGTRFAISKKIAKGIEVDYSE